MQINKPPAFRCFQCIHEGHFDKNDISSGGYLKHGEPHINNQLKFVSTSSETNDSNTVFLFGRYFAETVWLSDSDIKILFHLARKGIMQLENAATVADNQKTDYSEIRKCICELWLASRVHLTSPTDQYLIQDHLIPLLRNALYDIKRLHELSDYILFNSQNSSKNINNNAAYNFLHLSLDTYWVSLTIEHIAENNTNTRLEVFEKNLTLILSDLIHVAVRKFDKVNSQSEIFKRSAFICSCFKELLLLIQLYVEQQNSEQFCKDFWHYFNNAMKEEMKLKSCTNVNEAVKGLWVLYHVAQIQGYDKSGVYIGPQHQRVVSNYAMVEQCLKIVTSVGTTSIDEQLLCSCLQLLASLQINWWAKDATFDLLQLLWEFFYKRINISSFVCGESENRLAISQKSCDFISTTNSIMNHDLNKLSSLETSYDIFLCLLGKYLTANPMHWPKLKGRIYSKLPPPKLANLTDTGLQNLIQLFFVLAHSVNFAELTDKLQSLLSQLPAARCEDSIVIWSAHIALLLMRAQRGMSLNGNGGVGEAETCAPILLAVHSASSDRSRAHLMRFYVDGIKKIIDIDTKLQCQEHVLFGGWISRYLQWSSHSDASYLLEILIGLVEKVLTIRGQLDWWLMLESQVVPSIMQLSTVADSPQQVAELAATIINADNERFKGLLKHMAGDSVNVPISIKFLSALLEGNQSINNLSIDYQTIICQAWVRIAVLSTDKSDLIQLTQVISRLPNWSNVIGSFDVLSTEDPLYAVLRLAGTRVSDARTMMESAEVKRWFETYFGRMDRWAEPVFSAAERGENAQLVLRLFTCVALMFLRCAPALYIKNKSTCLLYRLSSTLLLPTTVLMNKRPVEVILGALRRTWHLIVRGIARLDYKTDNYIERTLRDMVIRYVPHMYDASSPIIRCLDAEFEDEVTSFILDKIASTFLTCKSKHCHEFSSQAIKLTLEMFRVRCESVPKTNILVQKILPSLFEQLTFTEDVADKKVIFQIIETMKSNQHYSEIREMGINALLNVIDKHLSFYSSFVFRFVESLISVMPTEVESTIPNLKEAVQKVECMRGVGYDNTLRKGLDRIQDIVNQQSK